MSRGHIGPIRFGVGHVAMIVWATLKLVDIGERWQCRATAGDDAYEVIESGAVRAIFARHIARIGEHGAIARRRRVVRIVARNDYALLGAFGA